MRTLLLMLFALLVCVVPATAGEFFYRDYGWRVENGGPHGYAVRQENGFEAGGKNARESKAARKFARRRTRELDDAYNGAINEIGNVGHGVAYPVPYPVIFPTYLPPPPPVRVVRYYYYP